MVCVKNELEHVLPWIRIQSSVLLRYKEYVTQLFTCNKLKLPLFGLLMSTSCFLFI